MATSVVLLVCAVYYVIYKSVVKNRNNNIKCFWFTFIGKQYVQYVNIGQYGNNDVGQSVRALREWKKKDHFCKVARHF